MLYTVCVYCGSSDKVASGYLHAAFQIGAAIARRGLRLVYGAGKTGLMGAVADGALQAGGQVIGVIPELFNTPGLAHAHLSQLEVVENMHQRKARLVELADAFIALPGGFGTFEELFEVLTWAQIGLHSKPIGLFNTQGYFNALLAMVAHAQAEGMIYAEHSRLFVHADTPEALLDALDQHSPPPNLERWLVRD